VRRLKRDVLPQLPAKRRVIVPVPLTNESSYRLAERDFVAWLGSQPDDPGELDAKEGRALRARRLTQLNSLQRLAAEAKLAAAAEWIRDFLASGEPLVVFARHVAVQEALLERFPDALHLMGRDTVEQREESVRRFQEEDGPQLIVCAIGVAGQGVTLTRASNVCFLELEWTPALHDQAEDRVHRIGQERDAVTAWYLIAAGTVDEALAAAIDRKRSHVSAVTEGRAVDGDGLVDEVLRQFRNG
jgi:SNF2 family DNA or RNA helicase